MKFNTYITLLCLIFSFNTFAQLISVPVVADKKPIIKCYAEQQRLYYLNQNPDTETREEFEEWLAPLVKSYKLNRVGKTNNVKRLPVIFHIIHNGEAIGTESNVSDDAVRAQIAQLNLDFRSRGSSSDPDGADTEIEFCLATTNPEGNMMDSWGINRIDRNTMGWGPSPYGNCSTENLTTFYIDSTIKPQTQWDPEFYINIWVIDLCEGTLGYAPYPTSSTLPGIGNGGVANRDGIVIRSNTLGSIDNPNPDGGDYDSGRTATHEMGHFLGLLHIWGDGGCSVDDFCADTPNSDEENYGCPTDHISCGTTDMVRNYMDYTDDACMNIFTEDQKARMQTVLENSPRRRNLANNAAVACYVEPICTDQVFCETFVDTFPYTQGFETSFGDWTAGNNCFFDWTRNSGGTLSDNTGPSSAVEGSWYTYVEASKPNYSFKTTHLNGPCFVLWDEDYAMFTFQYHMYGESNMGSLTLEAKLNSETDVWSPIWERLGNSGNQWLEAEVDLEDYLGNVVMLRFVGTTGTTYKGDIAIDDIKLTTSVESTCKNITVSINLDDDPEETTWQITDFGKVSASGGPYEVAGGSIDQTLCLLPGCYLFTIFDSYGDGICCDNGNGSFAITNSNGSVLASGGDFDDSLTFNFCTSGALKETQQIPMGELSIFTNPVQHSLKVNFVSAWVGNSQIRIIDVLGATVNNLSWSVVKGDNQREISTNYLPNGSYLLVIENGEKLLTKRFVVFK